MTIHAHPEIPEFDYLRPATLIEASRFLAEHPLEARPLLGGTDVFVRLRDGIWHAKYLVDVKRIDGAGEAGDMRRCIFNPTTGLTIGAAVSMNQVIAHPAVQQHYPLLAEACRSVASYQLRNRATIVGNICNASPAGDTIGACLLLGGVLKVHGTRGWREVPLDGFFTGPGKTTLAAGDIVTTVHFPPPPPGCAGTYLKLGRNRMSDLSIVGAAVLGYPDAAAPSGHRFGIALASVAPVPLRATAAEEYLALHSLNSETIQAASKLAAEACSPIDDVRGGARYRRAMVRNLVRKGLKAVGEAVGQ